MSLNRVTDKIAQVANSSFRDKTHVMQFLKNCTLLLKNIYISPEGDDFISKLQELLDSLNNGRLPAVIRTLLQNRQEFHYKYLLQLESKATQTQPTSKPNLTLHLGDYLKCIVELNEKDPLALITTQNAGNPYHPGGCVAYGVGSAEEALARSSSLWIELLLTSVQGTRQLEGLKVLFETIIKIAEVGEETFLRSALYDQYIEKIIPVVFRDESSYHLDNTSTNPEHRCHASMVFQVTSEEVKKQSFENVIHDQQDLHKAVALIEVANIAAIDKRVVTGTAGPINAIGWKLGYDQEYMFITKRLINDTINVSIKSAQKNLGNKAYLIMLPIGCGAFLGNVHLVAKCYVEVLTERQADLAKFGIDVIIASFADNYQALANAINAHLGSLFNIDLNVQNFIYDVANKEQSLQLLSNHAAEVDTNKRTVALKNVNVTNSDEIDAIIMSTNPNLAPEGGMFASDKSLIGKLCSLSNAFKLKCQSRPAIRPGQVTDMGTFQIKGKTKPLDIVLTTVHRVNTRPSPEAVLNLLDSYANALFQLNEKYKRLGIMKNVGLSLLGAGHYNWDANKVVELAAFVVAKFLEAGLLTNIKNIFIINYGVKTLEIIRRFEESITLSKEAELIDKKSFDKWWTDTLITFTSKVDQILDLEPAIDLKASKQNATIFLVYEDQAGKERLLIANKDTGAKALRQFKDMFSGEYSSLKTPGGTVDPGDSIIYTALKELHEEANINYNHLLKYFPNARFGYIDSVIFKPGFAIHAYVIHLGKATDDMLDKLNIMPSDDINNVGFADTGLLLQNHAYFLLPNMQTAKPFDEVDKIILKDFVEKKDMIALYALRDVLQVFDVKQTLATHVAVLSETSFLSATDVVGNQPKNDTDSPRYT